MRQATPEAIAGFVPSGSSLCPDDVIVQHLKLNYASKDKNPVDQIGFFSNWQSNGVSCLLLVCVTSVAEKIHIPKKKVSFLIPDQFEECYLRVYCRDPAKVHLVHQACEVA